MCGKGPFFKFGHGRACAKLGSACWKNVLLGVSGSLGTSVFDSKAVLVGASGGVYALLAAHVANILLVREKKISVPEECMHASLQNIRDFSSKPENCMGFLHS